MGHLKPHLLPEQLGNPNIDKFDRCNFDLMSNRYEKLYEKLYGKLYE